MALTCPLDEVSANFWVRRLGGQQLACLFPLPFEVVLPIVVVIYSCSCCYPWMVVVAMCKMCLCFPTLISIDPATCPPSLAFVIALSCWNFCKLYIKWIPWFSTPPPCQTIAQDERQNIISPGHMYLYLILILLISGQNIYLLSPCPAGYEIDDFLLKNIVDWVWIEVEKINWKLSE